MRTQRGLLFDQDAPSAVIQEKGKELKTEGSQGSITQSTAMPKPHHKPPEQGPPKTRKRKHPKKKSPSADDLAAVASSSGEQISPVSSQDGKAKKRAEGSKTKKKRTRSVEEGTSSDGLLSPTESTGSRGKKKKRTEPVVEGASSDGLLSPTGGAASGGKKKKKRSRVEETDGAGKGMAEQVAASLKAEIDPILKVKKSGVVIGPSSSRGNSRRPSLTLFEQPEGKDNKPVSAVIETG